MTRARGKQDGECLAGLEEELERSNIFRACYIWGIKFRLGSCLRRETYTKHPFSCRFALQSPPLLGSGPRLVPKFLNRPKWVLKTSGNCYNLYAHRATGEQCRAEINITNRPDQATLFSHRDMQAGKRVLRLINSRKKTQFGSP